MPDIDVNILPDSSAELKLIILNQQEFIRSLQSEFKRYTDVASQEIANLRIEVATLKRFRFARKSEKWTLEDQSVQYLFNEAEVIATGANPQPEEKIVVKSHTRKKPGRKAIDPKIPRTITDHNVEKTDKICSHKVELKYIGFDKQEILHYIPARVYVEEHRYHKYVCKECEKQSDGSISPIISAQRIPSLIRKGFASASLLAYIAVSKFVDHLPLFRIERIFARSGVRMKRRTMSIWLIIISRKLLRIIALMRAEMMTENVMAIDETVGHVLEEPGRKFTDKGYVWHFRGGTRARPILIFKYHSSRSGKVARSFIKKSFIGTIVSDAFSGYNIFLSCKYIILAACWAHVRRKFFDAYKVDKRAEAKTVLILIKKLYAVETEIREYQDKHNSPMSFEEIYKLRQEKSKLVILNIYNYLKNIGLTTHGSGNLGKAVNYALNNWTKLNVYLDNPYVPIDNNPVENGIRPFVLGRKNWLFMGNLLGARASMSVYSILYTLIANSIEPNLGFHYILDKLPLAKSRSDFLALMPQNLDPEKLRDFAQSLEKRPVYVNIPRVG